ncbi:hypothetical protein ACIA98_41315 [Streptomyces sp. NPDC051366]|uniref:hypothetical protein n=1 Tax=Streptomyces sp. NPDC051366 TaxID=3365652 RepID=UPI003788CF98
MGVRPERDEVIKGLPAHVTAGVERLADELVALADVGVDVTDIGEGPRKGIPVGLRRIPLLEDGWFYALPLPRMHLIAIVRVIPPYTGL